jgi:hypothetical protein
MLRFYWKLLRRTPLLLWESARKWDTVAGIATLCLLGLGVKVDWMPWWLVFVPILLLFLYGLLNANYEAFRDIEQSRDALKETNEAVEKRLKALREQLTTSLDEQIERTRHLTAQLSSPAVSQLDNEERLCLHLADELEQEHERYENDEQKIASWAAGFSGSGASDDDFDRQVARAQDENFMETLNKYDRDLKGRLLALYDTLEPQGWFADGDRSRIENLDDPHQMRDLAKRLRGVCGKLSRDSGTLREGERRKLIEKWRAEIRDFDFDRFKRSNVKLYGIASPFIRTDAYSEMRPHLPPGVRQRLESDIPIEAAFPSPRKQGSMGDRRVLLDEVARLEKEWGLI